MSRQRDVKGSGGDKELRLGFNLEETLGGALMWGAEIPQQQQRQDKRQKAPVKAASR